jgi:hypothetical protein
METKNPKEYIAPEVKIIKVLVEQGFSITGIVNGKGGSEKHEVDEEIEVW